MQVFDIITNEEFVAPFLLLLIILINIHFFNGMLRITTERSELTVLIMVSRLSLLAIQVVALGSTKVEPY